MADDSKWTETLLAILDHPEKGALFLVIIAGAWRWIRELFREHKEDEHYDSLLERTLKEGHELREENARLRKENHDLQKEHQRHDSQ